MASEMQRFSTLRKALGFFVHSEISGPKEGYMETSSAIMIRLPEVFGGNEARNLRRELKSKIANDSPCVVVDMSRVKKIGVDGLEGLLECMEEVANNDGAMELGAISPEAATMLELTRMDQLFQKFPAFQADRASSLVMPERVAESDQVSTTAVQPQPMIA